MATAPAPDDDRTVTRVPSRAGTGTPGHVLPPGTRIGGLEITGLIGEGGFGIVYRAYDASLDREVAVKEYMPGSLASRAAGSADVAIRSERHREAFAAGLKSFVNEARLLARFDHPALVKVFRFWEGNRTAYMAMPYYQGPTLKAALRELGAPPDEAQLRAWLRPLLDALSVMHKENCFHRDIAPDNILLTERGPLLLDFGAARRVIGDMTQALTVVLKPGYAPIEQYGESATMTQGPWTDLYALASVVHYAITGHAPMASVERMMGATLEPLAVTAAGRCSGGFLRAIDAALALKPGDRPQSVAQFRTLLNAGLPADSPELFAPSGFQSSDFRTSGFTPSSFDEVPVLDTSGDPEPTVAPSTFLPSRQDLAAPAPQAPPPASRRGWIIGAAVGMAALAGAGGVAFLFSRRGVVEPGAAAAPPVAAAPVAAPTASSAVTPTATAPATLAEAPGAPASAGAAPPSGAGTAAEPLPPTSAAPAPPPIDAAPAPLPGSAAPEPPPSNAVPVPPPSPAPAAESRPAAPAPTPPEPRRAPAAPAVETAPRRAAARPERCSDILQKASLEPLTAEEAAYLRSACR